MHFSEYLHLVRYTTKQFEDRFSLFRNQRVWSKLICIFHLHHLCSQWIIVKLKHFLFALNTHPTSGSCTQTVIGQSCFLFGCFWMNKSTAFIWRWATKQLSSVFSVPFWTPERFQVRTRWTEQPRYGLPWRVTSLFVAVVIGNRSEVTKLEAKPCKGVWFGKLDKDSLWTQNQKICKLIWTK